MTLGLAVILAVICGFGVLNGFRDAPNAVALAVRFRALTPRLSLQLAAGMNALGVLFGAVLMIVGVWIFTRPLAEGASGLLALGAAIMVTVAWGILLWWRRIPSSTTHALFASLLGAALAATLILDYDAADSLALTVRGELVVGLVVGPLLAWLLARIAVRPTLRVSTSVSTVAVQRRSRITLAVSSSAIAFGHGVQTGQRLGLLWGMALGAAGYTSQADISPAMFWAVALLFAGTVAVGTLGGAWRISWTLTERLATLDPLRGSVAATTSAVLLFFGSILLHVPISSTHTTVAGIVGAGQDQSFSSVRWGQVARVIGWWIVSPMLCVAASFILTVGVLSLV
ncbi:MAG: inorganic phosphate transporter [Micrococcus sp.]|nr:inorganic phosphate transporter [Micrococcus sp.]